MLKMEGVKTGFYRKTSQEAVSGLMKKMLTDDLNQEKMNWIIENLDEIFDSEDENENDTY